MIDPVLLRKAAELFNRKLYFECHDLLEESWSEARGEDRDFLQALIQLSVGLYHVAAGNHAGAVSLLGRGVAGLEPFVPDRDGLATGILAAKAARCLEVSERALAGEPIEWSLDDVPTMELSGAA